MHFKKMMGSGIGLAIGVAIASDAAAAVTFDAWANVNRFYSQTSVGSSYSGSSGRAVIRTNGTSYAFAGPWQSHTPAGPLSLTSTGMDGRQTFSSAMVNDAGGYDFQGNWNASGSVTGTGAGNYSFNWWYRAAVTPQQILLLDSASVALLNALATTGGSGMATLGVVGNVSGAVSWALQRVLSGGGYEVVTSGSLSSRSFQLDKSLIDPGDNYVMTLSKFGDSSGNSNWSASNGAKVNPYAGTTNITVFSFGSEVPAPGALALLLTAGITVRNRRR